MRKHELRWIAVIAIALGIMGIGLFQQGFVAAAPQRDQANEVFLPVIPIRSSPVMNDMQVIHLGLFQSVQSQSNDVTLVARKPAILRVYAQASHSGGPAPFSQVRIDARRNGKLIGSLTSDPQVISAFPSSDEMASTINVELPVEWLSGSLELTATIDGAQIIPESDETNNSIRATFQFHDVAPLELAIIPITYHDTVTGRTYAEPAHDPISGWLLSAFPVSNVSVTLHAPLQFTGNLRQVDEWGRLLNEITALWGNEAGPNSSQIYFGLVPNRTADGSGWFDGGVSGLGWIGQRVSVGLDTGPKTGPSAAHEIGHNLGRRHAPCGNPSGVDPHFPYPNASIGVFGVDTTDETLLDPNLTHDVMSYCGPEWVSDYTYEGLFQDQSLRGGKSNHHGEGTYITTLVDSPQADDLIAKSDNSGQAGAARYRVQVLDDRGTVVASYPAQLYVAEEMGVTVTMLGALIPTEAGLKTGWNLRFLDGEQVVLEKSLNAWPELK